MLSSKNIVNVNLGLEDMLMISKMAPKAIVIISDQKWRNTTQVLEKEFGRYFSM